MRSKIYDLIQSSNSVLLLTHENPDGDAVGSVLAFYHYLTSINKDVDMVIQDIPNVFSFLPSINKSVDRTDREYDLGIVLDCATEKRIGQTEDLLSRCKNTIAIDHHVSNTKYCNVNLIEDNTSSCCQVVYYLLKEWNVSLSKEIGEALSTGLLTDTNGFSNNNVNSDTFQMAADLSQFGVDIHKIYFEVLSKKSKSQYQLMQLAMSRLELINDGKIAFTYILRDDFDKVNAVNGDHEGLVDIGRNIDGVEVSLFIREDDGWKISLRSTGTVDVNKIAMIVGGGGHFMAAGGKYNGTFEETKNILIDEIKKVL